MAEKEIDWRGTSREDLIAFPEEVRRTAGFELAKVQHGLYPTDWKPISIWGSGVIEIRLDDAVDEYRVVYVAKFADKIYVLHSFKKKSRTTSKPDVDIIKARYNAVVSERRNSKNAKN